jgi:hypothetical protein
MKNLKPQKQFKEEQEKSNTYNVSDNEVKFCEDCQKWVKTPKCSYCGNENLISDWTY